MHYYDRIRPRCKGCRMNALHRLIRSLFLPPVFFGDDLDTPLARAEEDRECWEPQELSRVVPLLEDIRNLLEHIYHPSGQTDELPADMRTHLELDHLPLYQQMRWAAKILEAANQHRGMPLYMSWNANDLLNESDMLAAAAEVGAP